MSEEGSEDSPPRPKRKIKKVMVLPSSSSSDSDDSVTIAGTRRKRLRVVSDEGASDSSGSSVVRAGTRRARALPKLRDSDLDSDTSGWATDHSDEPKPTPATTKPTSGFASDSSEGNSDKCSICLLRFTTQEVGTPQSCEHIFCLDCITEWSKNVNTCPVDRMTFDYLVVRACAGGRVLRTEPVRVVERRPSVEMLVIEDPTVCEICGSTENEEEMLLCDGCDLGYHMQCLTPPLRQVPMDQWLCPNCDDLLSVIHLSEVDNLFSDIVDMDMDMSLGPRASSLREVRHVRRSSRTHRAIDEPSTSSGHRGNTNTHDIPTTSRGARSSRSSNSRSTRRRPTTTHRTHRRKYRRRTKTVIIEYEVQENGKRPITGTVRRVKKRKTRRRQPRTAARRSHVLESVRAKLASQSAHSATQRDRSATQRHYPAPMRDLALSRQRAGIPSLSLLGDPYQLDYFSDNENDVSEGASTAVAIRPTSSILSAYRQARRKMISIPSPPHASSTPDVLSSILESQALLHSKKSVVSISVDGNVNIKLESREQPRQPKKPAAEPSRENKIDISKGEDATRKAPSYPGQSRGNGGGWGGGYRGNYHRDQGANNFNNRGGNYDNSYGGGYQNRQGNSFHQNNNMRREDGEAFNNYARRPHQYSHNDDSHFERNRRQSTDNNRGPQGNFPHNQRLNDQNRFPSWQPHAGSVPGPRQDAPPAQHRHSFGGFDNPLDMRVGQLPLGSTLGNPGDVFPSTEPLRREKPPPPQPFQPLPEPPIFKFDKTPDVEKSEDERSDSGLVIDTEKYDPMEPTNDDDSSEEDKGVSLAEPGPTPADASPQLEREAPTWQASAPPRTPTPPPSHSAVQNILAGIDTSTINVPHNILDSAVRQVLKEHRNLITPTIQSQNDKSDEDSDGDCPNFSIYSATSVHIANNTGMIEAEAPKELPQDNLEDLVQEDDESPETTPSTAIQIDALEKIQSPGKVATPGKYSSFEINMKKKTHEEYKEKVSKRCPITTNTRNPIKIKLNTPTLIKRQITLYDEEEDIKDDVEPSKAENQPETQEKTEHKKDYSDDPSESPKIDENVSSDKKNVKEVQTSTNESRKNSLSEENDKLSEGVDESCATPDRDDDGAPPSEENDEALNSSDDKIEDLEEDPDKKNTEVSNESDKASELGSNDDLSDVENEDLCMNSRSPTERRGTTDRSDENLEKMTESISETEDERSYTPCLDENKSKDTSLETDKDKGIEGLDTEMISEDEGNEMFSDAEKPAEPRLSPPSAPAGPRGRDEEEGEILDKKKDAKTEETKKKKKKESKKESKDKKVKPKKSDVAFKKLSKSGKERNYRERDKEEKSKSKKERRDSGESTERERLKQKRKEKRKDLERYDVRNVVIVKRKKLKDPFGRDISPRAHSRSASAARSPLRSHSPSPLRRHSPSPVRRRSPSSVRRRSPSPVRRRSPSPVRRRSPSPLRRRSPSPLRRRSPSPLRRRSPSLGRRRSLSPVRRRSVTPARRRSPSPMRRRSPDPRRRSSSRARGEGSPAARASASPRAGTPRAASPAPRRRRRRSRSPEPRRRRSADRVRKRRRSADADRSPKSKPTKRKKRARSERAVSRRRSPRRKSPKRKKPRRRSATREPSAEPAPPAAAWSPASGPPSPRASRLPSPRTPPHDASPERAAAAAALDERRPRRRRDLERARHRRPRDPLGPSKEVFTSGDNILVSVSFQERERLEAGERRERRERRRSRRRRRRRAAEGAAGPAPAAPKPVAIIDLERSPFRELTPSPKNVIVLSDSEPGEKEPTPAGPGPGPATVAPEAAFGAGGAGAVGPKTPPEPGGGGGGGAPGSGASAAPAGEERGPNTPPEPPSSPDAYDPFEPTRSASASPAPAASPPRTMMTLETAQKTNMSADEVLDRRPLSPMEKVMALLQSTRDVSPEPPPGDAAAAGPSLAPPAPPAALTAPPAPHPAAALAPAPAAAPSAPPVRIVLPSPTRAQPPKLFLAKPSPIKSDPIKPMQAAALPRAAAAPRRRDSGSDLEVDSPYSPGSSDFGDLFEPPAPGGPSAAPSSAPGKRDVFDVLFDRPFRRKPKSSAAKVPVKLNRKKGKTQVGVKVDEDNLKVLDDLPSSAVEMQVKSKFLKKLNRQERVVEEVKLVLKPHYNKKHVTKDEYKHILRRTVPKICHNKTGEINPTKIQALVEAYVKKFRKKHKLGLV